MPEGGIHARIARIAAQRLLPIRKGIDGGIVELLRAQAGQVQFFVRLDLAAVAAGAVTVLGIGMGVRRMGL